MDEGVLIQSKLKTVGHKATLQQLFKAIDHSNGNMLEARRDIEQLKADTDTLKAETRAILTTMGATF